MAAYYNEIDPYAAQWLRNLIAAGHIAPGDVDDPRSQGRRRVQQRAVEFSAGPSRVAGIVGDSDSEIVRGGSRAGDSPQTEAGNRAQGYAVGPSGALCVVADASGERFDRVNPLLQWEKSRRIAGHSVEAIGRGPVNGFWRSADWISCRDDRWRPVEPGAFPLVDGAPARVGRLRGYGNAINAQAACAFIEAASEALDEYDLI